MFTWVSGHRNQKCQLARSNQHKEHWLTCSVNQGNAVLQDPVCAQFTGIQNQSDKFLETKLITGY